MTSIIMYTIKFFKDVVNHAILNAWDYKHHSLAFASGILSLMMDYIFNGAFLGIGITFLALFFILVVVDLFTGVQAAKFQGEVILSGKLSYTFHKLLVYILFFWLVNEIFGLLIEYQGFGKDQGIMLLSIIRYFVFILLALREFISIGENIEKRFGKKPPIFNIAEKIADLIEMKIMKKIEESSLCKDEKKD